jgi:hypothetical protein
MRSDFEERQKMAETVYILCTLTSGLCTVLLLKHYKRSKVPLVMWTGICFVALTIINALLFIDVIIFPSVDLSVWRITIALAGAVVLLYELIRSST